MSSKKVYVNISNKYDRIIVLIDMDCFYCQVEEKLKPSLAGKPIAVVQYNTWQGGGIIAVNYAARAQGVTRHMRGDEAKEQCPEIELISVPSVREKADLTKYREAGKEVATVLQSFTPLLERASIDEAYLDITENVLKKLEDMNKGLFQFKPEELRNTFVVGYDNIGHYVKEISTNINFDNIDFECSGDYLGEDYINLEYDDADLPAIRKSDLKLLVGASIVNEIRKQVKEKTGYDCSAGIAHNKILAKLACGINKPNKQTILPLQQIRNLFATLPVGKVKGLGGKFGKDVCEILKVKYVGDLEQFSENELKKKFDEKIGSWLYLIARGIDLEAVIPRFYSKSIGCCKKFPGKNSINGVNTLNHWLLELSKEICDRMETDIIENNRKAKQMVVSYTQEINGTDVSSSRSTIVSFEPEIMAKYAFEVIRKNSEQFYKIKNDENQLNNAIKFLGISVGKFETIETKQNTLKQMFINQTKKKNLIENDTRDNKNLPKKHSLELSEEISEKSINLEEKGKKLSTASINSFFATHLEKKDEQIVDNNKNTHCPNNENVLESKKSFFLNAIKASKNLNTDKSNNISDISDSNIKDKTNSQQKEDTLLNDQNEKNMETIFNDSVPSTSKTLKENDNQTGIINKYVKNYVEFSVPKITDNDYVECDECQKKILIYDLQIHKDLHYAFKLSQEQRETYRQQIKSKIKSPPAKKLKINSTTATDITENKTAISNNNNNKGNYTLDKFLIKKDDQNLNRNLCVNDKEPKELCRECNVQISIRNILEHQDYHVAKKLQQLENNIMKN